MLITGSLFFYGYWKASYLFILLGSVGLNYLLSTNIHSAVLNQEEKRSKHLLYFGISANILLIGFYKYLGFSFQIFSDLGFQVEIPKIILPLAISFFTFQQIAYLVDCYKQKVEPGKFHEYLMFVSFFPQLIAGPIVNFKDFYPQLKSFKILNPETTTIGLQFFIIGLFKKVVIADSLSSTVARVFDTPETLAAVSTAEAWISSLAYTFQLYFDFSGYADMAVGLALIFGLKIPYNFNSPYKATSIQTFWRDWHMTLSAWFKEYVYFPLGGNRKGLKRTVFNLFIVAFISGVWHGAAYGFIVWGVLHGLALIFHRIWSKYTPFNLWAPISWAFTFLFVHIAWVFFRAPELATAHTILSKMFLGDTNMFSPATADYVMMGFLSVLLLICVAFPNSITISTKKYPLWVAPAFGVILFLAVGFMNRVSEFIYFQF